MENRDPEPTASAPSRSQWICTPYGTPDATSEVTRVAGYYRVTAFFTFGVPEHGAPAARAA